MKKIYFLLLTLLISSVSFGQGLEDFTNSLATGSYADDSFVGNDGVTWSYIHSRDANGDNNGSGINLPALMLRRVAEGSKITSSTISGGIADFSVKLYKGFTSGGDRQVELFINGTSYGLSTAFDDNTEQTFNVTGINIPGNVVIEIVNPTTKQIIIDDISWTGFSTACGVLFSTESYTCNANTVGDNNDSVTINIPYTGSDAAITAVTTTSGGTIGGDNPATVANGTITITGLMEGAAWDVALVGGDCGAISASGTVPAAECDPIPNTCFDLSTGSELFELVAITPNSGSNNNGTWEENAGSYSANGYCGGGCAEATESWLVFGPLDMTGVTNLTLDFNAAEQFGTTDLVVAYTAAYSGCPSGSTWTTAQTITDAGAASVDVSAAAGTEVFIGIQYLDDGTDSYSNWTLSNVALNAFGTCPTLGARPTSNCIVCDVTLQTETYTCLANTAGSNNDGVTVEIAYTGVESNITSITTTSTGTIAGDDPTTIADGTITITGLTEGDAWDLTINGGDCDGTTISGTVAAGECDPEIIVINEINADPSNAAGEVGDANGDGTADFSEDEFIEFNNTGLTPIVMDNYTIEVNGTLRHTFTAYTIQPGSFVTVFGGGTPTGIPGEVQVSNEGTSGLSLTNGGATIVLKDNVGAELVSYTYSGAGNNQSIAREPDFTGAFVQHTAIISNPVLFSPGINNDGSTLSIVDFTTTNFSVYPNPTNTGFVNITTTANEAINVTVFSILGKQVLTETINNNTLNVSTLNAGVYIMTLNQNGATTTKKLVIK
ncbi:T9SS type A sorting domain-containing protein [Lacinutrix algicola]|uniref:T9SS type A sorting domain-containing protein n=1 Tax=Lacinutrix algicola TaxID=342954 RepID=UPI0006E183ED|nr:T9SS type A sorting domain-containing protein [Lacinutrix algicola]